MKFEYALANDVVYHDFDTFNESITRRREEKFKKEYSLLKDNDVIVDIDNITEISDGVFKTTVNDVEFECLFKRKESNRLYVFFSGNRNQSEHIPLFKRWRYSSFVDGSTLNIADPMLRKYNKLSLGWYFGTNEENYYEYLVRIILKVAESLKVTNENILFYASSGGGYAALQCGCRIEGSTVIAINSQINLWLYNQEYIEKFINITNIELDNDKFMRNQLAQRIVSSLKTKFLLIENCRSKADMDQLQCLCKITNYKFGYGIQQMASNILLWVYDAEKSPTHNALDYPELFFAIDNLAKLFEKADEYKEIYEYITELWHEHYCLADKLKDSEKSNEQLRSDVSEITYNENVKCKENVSCLLKQNFLTKEGKKMYDFVSLFDAFQNNGIYGLSIDNTYSTDKSCDVFTVVIKNEQDNKVMYKRTVKLSQTVHVLFKINNNAHKLALRLYPNRPDASQGCSVSFENIRLFSLNNVLYEEE